MRKALLGLLPVMLMMLAFPALAEPYTFSNGAQWGMSKAEIAEIEKAEHDIFLFYIDANFDESQIGIYDTTGL